MTKITDRLIEAAGSAIYDEIKKWPSPPPFSGAIPGFAGATKQDVGKVAVVAALRLLSDHIYEQGRADLRAEDDRLWHIRNADADTWLDELANAVEAGGSSAVSGVNPQ
jgi:hypothetical protein